MKISVLTATYNRAEYLERLYDSIKENTGNDYDIEWLIMDDGSTDNTREICSLFSSKIGLEIKYYFQENNGKMSAINNLSKYVTGDLWIECDSDDYFVKDAFREIVEKYNDVADIDEIYAITYLKLDQNGNNMGKEFKKNENTMFDLYYKDGEDGEKAIVFISNVRKKYKYELENDERFVTEARMYHKMDKEYRMLCVNKPLMICEYQNDGYTKNNSKQFVNNPFGYYMYFLEILRDMDTSKVLWKKRVYTIKHYILFTYLTGKKLNFGIKGILNKLLLIVLYVPGIIKSKKYKKANETC